MTVPPIVPGNPGSQTIASEMPTSPSPQRPGWVVPVMAGLVVLLAIALIVTIYMRPSPSPSTPAVRATAAATAAEPAPEPTPKWGQLTANAVTLEVLIVSQQCFGSAGCNVEFEVQPTFGLMTDPVRPGSAWVVTYELTGAEDPYINSFVVTVRSSDQITASGYEIHGTYTTSNLTDRISTTSADFQLVATVTAARER
jgi:hypothetical protein